uniref:Uncharacterized protein n=1 Tax=Oryza brachyantha TaxID=4533 RepID=J3LDA5_ORYBR
MAGGRASAVLLLLLLVVAVAGATATATAASSSSSSPQVVGTAAADDMEHVKGMMECMIGCFTQDLNYDNRPRSLRTYKNHTNGSCKIAFSPVA